MMRRQALVRHMWLAGAAAATMVALTLPAVAARAAPATAGAAQTASAPSAASAGRQGGPPVTPSGSDAACPAATVAGAGSGNIGAPGDVHAIGGQSSATVVWCPPATGASSVVSYTVTSSGGQSVTARVPNDWAIIDGLSNGTSYTFTVTANTAGGSGPAATSGSVTPAQIAAPRHVLLGPAAAGQLRPVLGPHRRPAGVHHRRGVRPVADAVALAVAG